MGRGPSIEARKNASDAKRGKIFTKIIREIGVAARGGGGDPNNNPRLRVAMDKGLAVNMVQGRDRARHQEEPPVSWKASTTRKSATRAMPRAAWPSSSTA